MIQKRSLAEEVADRIGKQIADGKFADGEKLPTEPELMKFFGVGRSTIRESIRILENMGMVNVQQGRGTFVTRNGEIELVQTGALNRNTAVKVFDAVFADDADVDAYVKAHGLEQVSDAGLVAGVVDKVLAANPKSIQDFKAGKEKAFGFLVGQVMRELKGQASPQVVNQTIREKLEQL